MQKGRGFFRLVLSVSLLVFSIVSFCVFWGLKEEYYDNRITLTADEALTLTADELLEKYNVSIYKESFESKVNELLEFNKLSDGEQLLALKKWGKEKPYFIGFYHLSPEAKQLFINKYSKPISTYASTKSVLEEYGIKLPTEKPAEEPPPSEFLSIIKYIILGILGGIASIIPIWVVYGLTIFVVRGFMGKEKRGENE